MLESYALYSTELTDEERELGFELVEFHNFVAVARRFSETDQVIKMNVPVIGGHSYRHERLERASDTPNWVPVDSIVFPTAEQAMTAVGGRPLAMELCH